MEGKVKWFSQEKGYGFLVDRYGDERFFSVRDVRGADLPNNGAIVVFDPAEGRRGLRAENIEIRRMASAERDDRVSCSSCGKKMIPRIITGPPLVHGQGSWTPVPKKSVCPYCGGVHQKFSASAPQKVASVVLYTVVLGVFLLFLGAMLGW